MKTIVVDKIASVTQACALGAELRLSSEIPAAFASSRLVWIKQPGS